MKPNGDDEETIDTSFIENFSISHSGAEVDESEIRYYVDRCSLIRKSQVSERLMIESLKSKVRRTKSYIKHYTEDVEVQRLAMRRKTRCEA